MKIILIPVLRRILCASSSDYYYKSSNIRSYYRFLNKLNSVDAHYFSTNNSKDNGGGKENDRQVLSNDESISEKLAKPGGYGKAGERRKKLSEHLSKDDKVKTMVAAAIPAGSRTAKKNKESSTSDEELNSSSSSDEEGNKGGDKKLKKKVEDRPDSEKPSNILSAEMLRAVDEVSKNIRGDAKRIQSDLLKKLIDTEKETYEASKIQKESGAKKSEKAEEKTTKNLGSLLGRMKVDRARKSVDSETVPPQIVRITERIIDRFSKASAEQQADEGPGFKPMPRGKPEEKPRQRPRTTFFDNGPGLNIFTAVADQFSATPPLLPVWENLERIRLERLVKQEPRNGFEEHVRWTEEGKLFPYPIDNEYGHYELNVNFHEHVFLDHLLDEGFPATGPIRQFMELVAHGLSSNPYMTVEKKRGHIQWFRDYFKEKGPEIEKLHALDLKHQKALAEMEVAAETVSV